jgi:pyridoxal phosphate enzyme (YggS family)
MTDAELRTVLADRLAAVRGRIAAACARANRDPSEVTLVAVTKTVSPRVAATIVDLGVLDLGENRPQELWRKAEALGHLPIRWHLVGHLQRNKVERTLPLVHMVHSVDTLRLIDAIVGIASRQGACPELLLQANASREEQKHGFTYEELGEFRTFFASRMINVTGLMAMAAYSDNPEDSRPTFRELCRFRDGVRDHYQPLSGWRLDHLSMGMSGDFEVAIEEGATIVRIGTTLFEGLEGE